MRYILPAGVSCKRCVLQWYYQTGNSIDDFPEGFWNCADISILPKGFILSAPSVAPTTTTPRDCACAFQSCQTDSDCCTGTLCRRYSGYSLCQEHQLYQNTSLLALAGAKCKRVDNDYGCVKNTCCNPAATCGPDFICHLTCPSKATHAAPTPRPTVVDATNAPVDRLASCLCLYDTGCGKDSDCCEGQYCVSYKDYSQCQQLPIYMNVSFARKKSCFRTDTDYGCTSAASCCNPGAFCKESFCSQACPRNLPPTSAVTYRPNKVAAIPTRTPTRARSASPSAKSSFRPSSALPTKRPTNTPKAVTTRLPTRVPSAKMSLGPTTLPTKPSKVPTKTPPTVSRVPTRLRA